MVSKLGHRINCEVQRVALVEDLKNTAVQATLMRTEMPYATSEY